MIDREIHGHTQFASCRSLHALDLGSERPWMMYPPPTQKCFVRFLIKSTLGAIGHWTRYPPPK